MLTGRIPSAHGIKPSTVAPRNAIGHSTLPTVFGPRSLGTLRRTLELGSKGPNSAIAIVAVKPPHTTRIVHRDLCHNTSNNFLLASHTFTKTSALTADCTLTVTVGGVNIPSIVLNKHRTVSNSATRINPRITRGLNLPRIACIRRVLGYRSKGIAIHHRVSKNIRAMRTPVPLILAMGKDTTPYHPHGTGLIVGCGHTVIPVRVPRRNLTCTRRCRHGPCLALKRLDATSISTSLRRYNLDNSPAGIGTIRGVIFGTGRDRILATSSSSMRKLVRRLLTGRAVKWE